jgi:hypothetical protein
VAAGPGRWSCRPSPGGRSMSAAANWCVSIILRVIRSGTYGWSMPPITAAVCRSVTPVTGASGCSRPSAGSSVTRGAHLSWNWPATPRRACTTCFSRRATGGFTRAVAWRATELPGQLPGRRLVTRRRHCLPRPARPRRHRARMLGRLPATRATAARWGSRSAPLQPRDSRHTARAGTRPPKQGRPQRCPGAPRRSAIIERRLSAFRSHS